MSDEFELDEAAFDEDVLCADWMVAEMLERTEFAKKVAEAIAPVDTGGPHPSRYKDAFSAKAEVGESLNETRRAIGTLSNDAPEAWFVEFGAVTVNEDGNVVERVKAHHTLAKAVGL